MSECPCKALRRDPGYNLDYRKTDHLPIESPCAGFLILNDDHRLDANELPRRDSTLDAIIGATPMMCSTWKHPNIQRDLGIRIVIYVHALDPRLVVVC